MRVCPYENRGYLRRQTAKMPTTQISQITTQLFENNVQLWIGLPQMEHIFPQTTDLMHLSATHFENQKNTDSNTKYNTCVKYG